MCATRQLAHDLIQRQGQVTSQLEILSFSSPIYDLNWQVSDY